MFGPTLHALTGDEYCRRDAEREAAGVRADERERFREWEPLKAAPADDIPFDFPSAKTP